MGLASASKDDLINGVDNSITNSVSYFTKADGNSFVCVTAALLMIVKCKTLRGPSSTSVYYSRTSADEWRSTTLGSPSHSY